MSGELPGLYIQRHIEDGKGHVVWTFSPAMLGKILRHNGVTSADQLPEDFLRNLCHRASLNY